MASSRASITNEIIITAMDRFVWFVLLVVMSHLVAEFTRVTGYARGPRNDVILVNDTFAQPKQVQNLVLYPGQEYGLYERPNYYGNVNANSNSNNHNNLQPNAAISAPPPGNAEPGFFAFSFRPLIDSIFEIPISTLRAVNNLMARLTGSYQQTPTSGVPKSAPPVVVSVRGFSSSSSAQGGAKKSLLREESA